MLLLRLLADRVRPFAHDRNDRASLERDYTFREKLAAQPHFCMPHYRRIAAYASKRLGKRDRAELLSELDRIQLAAYDSLREDIKEFCRGFDYRAEGEPSEASKTAVDRAVRFLSGNEGREAKPL